MLFINNFTIQMYDLNLVNKQKKKNLNQFYEYDKITH